MKSATALTLLAIGAVFAFAVTAHPSFLNLQVVGWVLMLTGITGLVISRGRTTGRLPAARMKMRAAGRYVAGTPLSARPGQRPGSALPPLRRRNARHGAALSLSQPASTGHRRPPAIGAGSHQSSALFLTGAAPDAVRLLRRKRKLEAFGPHWAPTADLLGLGQLFQRRSHRRQREEQLRISVQAGTARAPVCVYVRH